MNSLNNRNSYSLPVLRAGSPNLRCQQGPTFLSSWCLPAVRGVSWVVVVSLQSRPPLPHGCLPSVCLCLHMTFPSVQVYRSLCLHLLFLWGTGHIGWRAQLTPYNIILTSTLIKSAKTLLPYKVTAFPVLSRLEVLRVGTWTCEFSGGGTIQSIAWIFQPLEHL